MRPWEHRPLKSPPLAYSARRFPEPAGDLDWINTGLFPPRALVACTRHRSMMAAAERDGELIAEFAAERTRLRKSKVVGIRRLAAAHETRLLGNIAKVLPIAIAPRGGNREDALVNALCL